MKYAARIGSTFLPLFFTCTQSFAAGAELPTSAVACAQAVMKAHSNTSKFEVATVCQGASSSTSQVENTLKCLKAAADDEDLSLTKMWTAQLCGRNGSAERIRCFKEAMGSTVGMTRQEALELCRP